MRVIVFFDLPTDSVTDRRNYFKFRRSLIRSGFVMLQESVYSKLAINSNQAVQISNDVKRVQPSAGSVAILTVTEKQFGNMEYLCGKFESDVLTSTDTLVVI